jgi:UDP-GlcNAc:undecaprenyl-phosphate GlcNAc-1-phosphate transferase
VGCFSRKGNLILTLLFLGVFAFSLVVSFAATRQVRDMATRRGWVSLPQDGQRVLESPRPRFGGVPIFVAFSLSVSLGLVLGRVFPLLLKGFSLAVLLQIYVPACLIFCLGMYEDLRGAGPYLKFIVQAIAAAMLFASGMRVLNLPVLFGSHSFPWFVGLPLTVLWVVAITNAFNLINSLDGLAAGPACFPP